MPNTAQFLSWAGCLAAKGLSHEIYAVSQWVANRMSRWMAGKTMQFLEGDKDGNWVFVWPVCVIFSVSGVGKVCSFYTIFEGSESRRDYPIKLFSWLAWGLVDFLVDSADWDGLLRKFFTILDDSWFGQFQDCILQASLGIASSSVQFWAAIHVHWGLKLCNAAQGRSSCCRVIRLS